MCFECGPTFLSASMNRFAALSTFASVSSKAYLLLFLPLPASESPLFPSESSNWELKSMCSRSSSFFIAAAIPFSSGSMLKRAFGF